MGGNYDFVRRSFISIEESLLTANVARQGFNIWVCGILFVKARWAIYPLFCYFLLIWLPYGQRIEFVKNLLLRILGLTIRVITLILIPQSKSK